MPVVLLTFVYYLMIWTTFFLAYGKFNSYSKIFLARPNEMTTSCAGNCFSTLYLHKKDLISAPYEQKLNQSLPTFRALKSWKGKLQHQVHLAAADRLSFDPESAFINSTVSRLVDLSLDIGNAYVHHDIVSCIRCLQYCKSIDILRLRRNDLMDVASILASAQKDHLHSLINLLEIIWRTANLNIEEDRLWRLTKAAIFLRLPVKVECIVGEDQSRRRRLSYRALRVDAAFIRLFHRIWSAYIGKGKFSQDAESVISFGFKLQLKTHLRVHKAVHCDPDVDSNNDYEKLVQDLFNELAVLTSKELSLEAVAGRHSQLQSLMVNNSQFRKELIDYLSIALDLSDKIIALYVYSLFYQLNLSNEIPRRCIESLKELIGEVKDARSIGQ